MYESHEYIHMLSQVCSGLPHANVPEFPSRWTRRIQVEEISCAVYAMHIMKNKLKNLISRILEKSVQVGLWWMSLLSCSLGRSCGLITSAGHMLGQVNNGQVWPICRRRRPSCCILRQKGKYKEYRSSTWSDADFRVIKQDQTVTSWFVPVR